MTDGRPNNKVIEPFGFELDNAQRGWARLPAWLLLGLGGFWALFALIPSTASLFKMFGDQSQAQADEVTTSVWIPTSIMLALICLLPAVAGLALRRKARIQSDSRRAMLLRRFGLIYIAASIYSASALLVYGVLRVGSNLGGAS